MPVPVETQTRLPELIELTGEPDGLMELARGLIGDTSIDDSELRELAVRWALAQDGPRD